MTVSSKIGLTYGYSFPVSAMGRREGVKHPWGYSLWWLIPGGSARKEYLFQASGIRKGRNFFVEVYERVRKSVILVGKGSTGLYILRGAFHGCEEVEKTFCFCDLFRF